MLLLWTTGLVTVSVFGPWLLYRAVAGRAPARPAWRSEVGWYVLVIGAAALLAGRDAVAASGLHPVERLAMGEICAFVVTAFVCHTARWYLFRRPVPAPEAPPAPARPTPSNVG